MEALRVCLAYLLEVEREVGGVGWTCGRRLVILKGSTFAGRSMDATSSHDRCKMVRPELQSLRLSEVPRNVIQFEFSYIWMSSTDV